MAAMDPMFLPPDLPVPEDDGAARHLPGTAVPGVALAATTGGEVTLAGLDGWSVVFAYPRTGQPGVGAAQRGGGLERDPGGARLHPGALRRA